MPIFGAMKSSFTWHHESTVDPDPNDSSTSPERFQVTCLWVNTLTKTAFVCVDATPNQAKWLPIGLSTEPVEEEKEEEEEEEKENDDD